MLVQTEETPNPNALKFLPGVLLSPDEPIEFFKKDLEKCSSPLGRHLLLIEGIESLMIGSDFVTLTKAETQDWYALKPKILGQLTEYLLSGKPVFQEKEQFSCATSSKEKIEKKEIDPLTAEIIEQIEEILETKVRPAVARDGGDIIFDRFEEGIVFLHLKGACSGCPSSTITLKSGIENLLKYYIPEVLEVRSA